MTRALVTGATGFIGHHLVKRLDQLGIEVTCLVRRTSDLSRLEPYNPRCLVGDVKDATSVLRATDGIDWGFHLAGSTKALRRKNMATVNVDGAHNVAQACSQQDNPPIVVSVSSLAACGPSTPGHPLTELSKPRPISNYGRSKLAGERAMKVFADRIPLTIIRPPIVLGEDDGDGFQIFAPIHKYGIHIVPTWRDHEFSLMHADDLSAAIVSAAEKGQRSSCNPLDSSGTYFATSDQILTYADLGRLIGQILGRSHTRQIYLPSPLLWPIGFVSGMAGQLRRRPAILNLDKIREAVGGSWSCLDNQFRNDTGYRPAKPLDQRFAQTAEWYFEHGWLKR